MMRPEASLSKEEKQRKEAMQKRLEKIDKDNPVVKKAIKNQEPSDPYEDFEVVHELVSAAFGTYSEKGNLKQCMLDLGDAIIKAAKNIKGGRSKKSHNDDDSY